MLAIPPELKKITPYVRRAEELDKDQTSPESRLVAYYCRQYAVQTGIPLSTSSPGAKTCLGHLLENLEKEKPAMDNFTREEAAFLCRKFSNQVFDKADGEDRMGMASKNTAKTFYAAANFLQILEQFSNEEEESEERAEDKKRIIYAKWKATEILKALKEGRTPTPGGYGEEEEEEEVVIVQQEETGGDTKETPMVETVSEDEKSSEGEEVPFEPPMPPIAPLAPPVAPPPPQEEEEQESEEEPPKEESSDEEAGTEIELGAPPAPAYSDTASSKPKKVDRPPVTFDLPPPPPVVAPAPPPAPPAKSSGGGLFGFGKKKGSKVTKAQIADAVELTRFALAALEDRDTELGAERLQQALQALGH